MNKILVFVVIFFIYQSTFAQEKTGEKEDSLSYNSLEEVADLYFSQKNYLKAKLYYSQLFHKLTNQEKREEVYLLLEQCNYYLKNYETPAQVYYNFIQKFPDSPRVPEFRYKLALFFEQLQQYNRAITEYKILVENYPQQVPVDSLYFQIALLYKKQKNFSKSISILDTLIENFSESELIHKAYQCKIDNYLADLDYRSAINLLVDLIEQSDSTETRIKFYQQLANIYERIGVFEEMINIYQILRSQCIGRNESKIITYNQKIAEAYLKLHEFIMGIRFCDEIITENSGEKLVSALYYKGRMYQEMNNPNTLERAEFIFYLLINDFTNYQKWQIKAMHSLANLYLDNNENEKAFEILRKLSETKEGSK